VTYLVDGVWNHNIHHMPVLLRALPTPCRRVLDVGCGQGFLLPGLAVEAEQVVGIDQHAPSLAEAAQRVGGLDNVRVIAGDFMSHTFDEPFDAVVSVAVLHHLPLEAGLERMAALTAPGGLVGVVGLAKSAAVRDYAVDAIAVVETRLRRVRRRYTTVTAPISDPEETYAQVRDVAGRVLPGVLFRRHTLFRYSLLWTKPRR
jgi:2-polyprenyl-3-methyl-5-hydroxy-6-metoxy-1,4-benzoquinol methylase